MVDLCKVFGMFKEKIEHTGREGGPIETREAPPAMVRSEVAKAVGALIAAAEAELGMPAGSGSDAERLKAIVASGEPLPPEIYACLFGGGGDGSR